MPDRQSGFDVNRDLLETVDPLDHARFNADRGIAGLAFRRIPVFAAAALVYRQRVCSHVFPFQSDQFTHAKPSPNRHEDHAGVRLGDQLKQLFELLWSDMRFGLSLSPSFRGQANSLDRVLD
jgi:hypothetical protein